MTGKVYIANFGEGNALWPIAKANQTIITIDNVAVHRFWQAGDRDGYIAAALEHTLTALGKRPSKQTAGRWYNLVTEMQETEGDIWISRQGDAIWWTISEAGELRQELHTSTNPERDGPQIWHIEKPCRPWSDRDKQGRPLRWEALHAKAREFLSTEATFQTIANDRGYAGGWPRAPPVVEIGARERSDYWPHEISVEHQAQRSGGMVRPMGTGARAQ